MAGDLSIGDAKLISKEMAGDLSIGDIKPLAEDSLQDVSIGDNSGFCQGYTTNSREPFKYKTSIKFIFDEREFTVQEVLDMSDSKFSEIYQLYEENASNLNGDYLMLPLLTCLIDNMERVVLERRMVKMEKKLNVCFKLMSRDIK